MGEKGVALILAILLLLIATFIGVATVNNTIYDNLLAGSERASEQAFYAAEAGINELMGRFREGATHKIDDNDPSNPTWKILLAKSPGKGASKIGFITGHASSILSLQNQLDFGVEIKHKIDLSNQVIKYGEAPIYLLKSYGFAEGGENKVIEVELKKGFSYDPPAAFYSKRPVNILGSPNYINGNDACGSMNKPGIISTTTIMESGNPTLDGSPPTVTQSSFPPPPNYPLKEMVDYLKGNANFNYSFDQSTILNGNSESWGTPTSNRPTEPITYTGPMFIVHFNMGGNNTLTLKGPSRGAGILLVNGNLELEGEFTWYGVIIVTGGLKYSGGGNKNVTGGVLVGDSNPDEISLKEHTNILYCSSVKKRLKEIVPPLKMVRWRDVF